MNKVDEKIQAMTSGDTYWIGSGYDLNEMQKVHHYLLELESKHLIQITNLHRESTSGHRLIDRVKIEKL